MPRIWRLTVAIPSRGVITDPTMVELDGSSGSLVGAVPSRALMRLWGPATSYPEYSMTVGKGPSASVLPGGSRRVAARVMPSRISM